MKQSMSFSCVHVTALDQSGTVCAYAEVVNRDGITADDIGIAVFNSVMRLVDITKGDETDCGPVIVRFTHDT